MTKVCIARGQRRRRLWIVAACLIGTLVFAPVRTTVWAQDDGGGTDRPVTLPDRQAAVTQRYTRLEELLLRLADMEAAENPQRSALLRRTAKQSRDKFIAASMTAATEALSSQQYRDAVKRQQSAFNELKLILKLLQTEDRSERIRDEKQRIGKLVQELKKSLNNQRSTRARTENGAQLDEVESEQKQITKKNQKLAQKLAEENQSLSGDPLAGDPSSEQNKQDAEPSESGKPDDASEQQSPQSQPSENAESGDSKPDDSKPSQSQPSESKPSESQPGESQSSESQPGESQPSESRPDASAPPPPATPTQQAEQKVRKAAERMEQAERKLEQAKREQAVEKQMQAEAELRNAIDELEKILRQLREEEMERELAKLEARVRRMLAMQQRVIDATSDLAKTPRSQRDRRTDLEAGKLVVQQKLITAEADRALLLLREEGSSVAFPEVMTQIRGDSETVVDRLARTEIDQLTRAIQSDIAAALEEMIEALAKAQRDLEEQKQQNEGGQQPPGGPQEQPLVAKIAELKLIRTMETRIQKTTQRYNARLQSSDAAAAEVLPLLQTLSTRQSRLYRLTRDLVTKRNQ